MKSLSSTPFAFLKGKLDFILKDLLLEFEMGEGGSFVRVYITRVNN